MYQDKDNRYRETRQGVALGGGHFVAAMAGTDIPRAEYISRADYFEIGYQMERKTPGHIRWGIVLQGGGWSATRLPPSVIFSGDNSGEYMVFQPRIALDTTWFLLGAGLGGGFGAIGNLSGVIPFPSLTMRLGPEDIAYLYGGILAGPPYITQGIIQGGVGFRISQKTGFRIGTNFAPYFEWGYTAGVERFLYGGSRVLTIEGRYGVEPITGEPEFGLGLKYMSRQVEIIPKTSVGVPAPQPPSPVAQEEPDLALLLSSLPPIPFATGQAILSQGAEALVETYAAVLALVPTATVMVEGHCDERGGAEYNKRLGEGRAMSVVRALHSRGVPTERLRVESKGDSQPVDEGHTEDAWARNRRVVLVLAR